MLVFLGAIYTYSEDNSYESSIGDIVVGVWVELAELHLIQDALLLVMQALSIFQL